MDARSCVLTLLSAAGGELRGAAMFFPAFASLLYVYGCKRLIVKLYFCSCRTSGRSADAIVMGFSF